MREAWLKSMEQEIRKVGGDLPIDAFLPELEASLEPEPGPPVEAPEAVLPPLEPRPRRTRPAATTAVHAEGMPQAAAPAAKPRADADMEDEIRAFMNRDQRGASDDDDISQFMGRGMDPNLDDV